MMASFGGGKEDTSGAGTGASVQVWQQLQKRQWQL